MPQAARLLADRHRRERAAFPALKQEFESPARAEAILTELLESDCVKSVCAEENGVLKGYLISEVDTDSVFGRHAFVRYAGLAIADTEPPELYRVLYAKIAEIWVRHGALAHYVVVPAGDPAVVDAWLRLGFAYQQVFGIARLSRAEAAIPEGITVKAADGSDAEALREISPLIYRAQAKSPTFAAALPERMAEIREGFGELPEEVDSRTLLAYRDGRLIAYQCAELGGSDSDMRFPEKGFELSIAGTAEDCRGAGVGSLLTQLTWNWALEQGYENVIIDWRISNLDSSNFWAKRGLQPVAHRMFRQIDERVYWADGMPK